MNNYSLLRVSYIVTVPKVIRMAGVCDESDISKPKQFKRGFQKERRKSVSH